MPLEKGPPSNFELNGGNRPDSTAPNLRVGSFVRNTDWYRILTPKGRAAMELVRSTANPRVFPLNEEEREKLAERLRLSSDPEERKIQIGKIASSLARIGFDATYRGNRVDRDGNKVLMLINPDNIAPSALKGLQGPGRVLEKGVPVNLGSEAAS